jgi:hypothetical protein
MTKNQSENTLKLQTETNVSPQKEDFKQDSEFVFADKNCTILARYCGKNDYVTIPETVERISGGAFANCKNLICVTIYGKVRIIDGGAFQNCSKLNIVEIGEQGLNLIGAKAFSGCASLIILRLPKSVNTIAAGAFEKCPKLTLTFFD